MVNYAGAWDAMLLENEWELGYAISLGSAMCGGRRSVVFTVWGEVFGKFVGCVCQ